MAEFKIPYSPSEIERKSYELIRGKLNPSRFQGEAEFELAVRVAHSTADIDIANSLYIHPNFVKEAEKSVEEKLPIFVDVEMARAGIRGYAESLGIDVICAVSDPEVIKQAKELGITRSAMAVRKILSEREVGLLVCGNSPTFLAETIKMIEQSKEGKVKMKPPKAIVGVPVGFISAEYVKNYLIKNAGKIGVPFVSNLSPKGGTPVAVSITLFIINRVRKKMKMEGGYGQHS